MTAKRRGKSNRSATHKPMLFSARNYKIMGFGVALVIIGFIIMYLENEVRGFISLYISPIMILTGYMIIIPAILSHKDESGETQASA